MGCRPLGKGRSVLWLEGQVCCCPEERVWAAQAGVLLPGPETLSDVPQLAQRTCGDPQVGALLDFRKACRDCCEDGSFGVCHSGASALTGELCPLPGSAGKGTEAATRHTWLARHEGAGVVNYLEMPKMLR